MLLVFGVMNVTRWVSGVVNTMLDPRLLYSCMTAALKGAQSESLPAARPVAYEHLIELFYQLAAAPHTSDATLAILRKVQLVAMHLDTIAAGLASDQVLIPAKRIPVLD